jgi:hypothetical protein
MPLFRNPRLYNIAHHTTKVSLFRRCLVFTNRSHAHQDAGGLAGDIWEI